MLTAQNNDTKSADKLFDRYEFYNAAKSYEKLVAKGKADSYVYKQLADSYYNIYNTVEAEKNYALALQTIQDPESMFRYAQMLKANGKYVEADKQMYAFASLAPNDNRAIQFKNDPDYLNKLNKQPKLFETKDFGVNSDKSDFGAVLTNDNNLFLTTARNKSGRIFKWTNEPSLDIYKSTYNDNATFSEPTEVKDLNSKYNDGPVAISADGNTIYFSAESFRDKQYSKNKEKHVKYAQMSLFKATKSGDKWINIQPLPFNSVDYSVSNPTLSKDGTTLYFSSNMPGSIGGIDIWKVAVNADGSFGKPENLGPNVNTEGRESFPFISDDNKLYFSSDSRPGYGLYDVFVYDLNKLEISKNLGKPVNSDKDDFSFSYNKSKKIAFFASNRNGQDDIFIANPLCGVTTLVTIKDAKTGALIPEAKVSLLESQKLIEDKSSTLEGTVTYTISCEKEYIVNGSKIGYESNSKTITKTSEEEIQLVIELNPIQAVITEKEIILQEIYFEFNKSNITEAGAAELNKLVQIMTENPNMEINVKSHTDSRGTDKFNENLSQRRAKSTIQYVISKGIDAKRISGKGYGESELKVSCGNDCTKEQHAQNRRSEFIIVKK